MKRVCFFLLFLFASLATSCQSHSGLADEEAGAELYKRAAFRTWLLFDSIDSRYTPYRLSPATNVRTHGRPTGKKLSARPGEWPIFDETMYTPLTPCDYAPDINPFLERLDLRRIAALCCRGMKGHIYFIPGKRETPAFPSMVGGFVSGFAPYLPASFLSDGEIRLAPLMDNLWLLYQLEQQGWVEAGGAPEAPWRWTEKARALPPPARGVRSLQGMPEELRGYFAVLTLIEGGDARGDLPPIAYSLVETEEEVSEQVTELRDGEGYVPGVGRYTVSCDEEGLTTPHRDEKRVWKQYIRSFPGYATLKARERGLRIMITPPDRDRPPAYAKRVREAGGAPYLFDFYAAPDEPEELKLSGKARRRPVLIFSGD